MEYTIHSFLEHMKTYSKDTKGVTRLAFTRESQEGWAYICQVMEELGLTVYTDAYGAILGYMEGKRKEGVIIGSHYDTVIHGGAYDGIAGVAIGLDVAASYRKRQEIPPYSLYILATNNEEGVTLSHGLMCSKNICDVLDAETYIDSVTGKTLSDCLAENWYIKEGKAPDDIKLTTILKHGVRYIEPHIEQGGILWENQEQIGIVKHIVGITRLYITLHGTSNHAGTTPMNLRKDPLCAGARIIGSIPEVAAKYQDAAATVGQIFAEPNAYNVIPSKVEFSVDIRSASNEDRTLMAEEIKQMVVQEAPAAYEIGYRENETAIPMNPQMAADMEHICKKRGLSYRVMNSGAGHDAQIFARFIDTVMLFVPSRDGISHSPEEYTPTEDMELAAKIIEEYLEGSF